MLSGQGKGGATIYDRPTLGEEKEGKLGASFMISWLPLPHLMQGLSDISNFRGHLWREQVWLIGLPGYRCRSRASGDSYHALFWIGPGNETSLLRQVVE